MSNFIYNITGGKPRIVIKPCTSAIIEGICRMVPAAMIFGVFNVIYQSFAVPGQALDTARLWLICGFLAGWMLVHYFAYAFMYKNTINTAYDASADGRIALAEHMRKLPLGLILSRDPGDLATMLISDYAEVENLLAHTLAQLVSAFIFPAAAFAALLFVNWQLAVAMFAPLPLAVLLILLSAGLQDKLGKAHIQAKVDSAGRLQEYLYGMREIKSHNLSGSRFVRLDEAFARLRRESLRIEGVIGSLVMPSILLIRSGLSIMLFAAAWLLTAQTLPLPVLLLFLLLGTRVYDPLTVALTSYASIRYSSICAERIMQLRQMREQTGGRAGFDPAGGISFEHVSFAYDQQKVLDDVSFNIPAGGVTALVGPSGSGKSTVTKLLARFWDVAEGRVLIGGTDVRELAPEKLLEHVSMVFQDVYLFKNTIGNNIKVGKMSATQAEIEEAARKACCHDFIMRLPLGYDTPVGEGGCTLSGGEKQRVSIARALLKDAPIVLLDEATASLDPENELLVQSAINALVSGSKAKTVVIIAHRLKTVRKADHIVVLENGRVAQQGTHGSLLESKGLYHRLWSLQQQAAGWDMRGN